MTAEQTGEPLAAALLNLVAALADRLAEDEDVQQDDWQEIYRESLPKHAQFVKAEWSPSRGVALLVVYNNIVWFDHQKKAHQKVEVFPDYGAAIRWAISETEAYKATNQPASETQGESHDDEGENH